MKLTTYTLSEVSAGIFDCPHSTARDEGEGYPLIRTPNVGRGRLMLEGVHRVSQNVYDQRNARAIPRPGDLIFAREAPAGNVALIQEGEKVCLGQRTVLIRPNKAVVNSAFLAYYLLSPEAQFRLMGRANGATVAHVNLPIIRNLKVDLPSMEVQERIAEMLSHYDSLIENNRRQIKLLEEAALRLYNEWFVDLRFPGHEHTPIIDGIPQGWRKCLLPDVAEILYGYPFNGKLFNSKGKGKPIVRIRNVPSGLSDDYTTEQASDAYVVKNGDVLVGMDGEFHMNTWNGGDAYLVQRTCCIRPVNEIAKGYLLQALYGPIKFFEKTLVGATVAHLGKKHLDAIELLLPDRDSLLLPFMELTKQRQTLLSENVILTEARDRLLPKLMSGEVEV